jgi:hypothetical protein
MAFDPSAISLIRLAHSRWWIAALAALLLFGGKGHSQDSDLPSPKLFTIIPPGGQAGSTVTVTFSGADLEEPQTLLFSNPLIKGEPLRLPAPPADPKNPTVKPMAPPVTQFKVTIPANTPLGIHDVRFVGKWGVSNPRAFVVGDLAEVAEKEPNDDVDKAQRVALNTTINGGLASATDVDFYVFAGTKGQRVVVTCLASSIDSRLHPVLELFDKAGRILASNRYYKDTDAVLDRTLPEDGDYYVRLHHFTYAQGDAEHFYRLTISTAPWIDAVFPPMVEPGRPAQVTVYGRNLPGGQLDPTAVVSGHVLEKITVTVDVPTHPTAVQRLQFSGHLTPPLSAMDGFELRVRNGSGSSNPYLLTFARAPIVLDNDANDTPETAQEVPVPCEIAGRIEKKHDRDWYVFKAKKGDLYSIEVFSERIGTKTDMFFLLRNAENKQDIVEQDDDPDILNPLKFLSRTDDPPRFRFEVPADGKYQIMVSSRESAVRAGPRQLYRLRIVPEQPDFRLVVMPPADFRPDSCRLFQGGQQFYTVLSWRLDGFNGPITVSAEGLPNGVSCPPQIIGPGLRQTSLVLSAASTAAIGVYPLTVKGTATINGQPVVREARVASITWPVQPGNGVPALSRLDRNLVLAIQEPAPYTLSGKLDKVAITQGDKANLALTLNRLWPDSKAVQIQAVAMDMPPNVLLNNNQPITFAPNATTATAVVDIQAPALPGTYNLVLRATAPIPYNRDPKAKEKPPTNAVLPSIPMTLTILPKQLATVALAEPNLTAKVGAQVEALVKVTRMFDFAGEFKIEVIIPAAVKGVTAMPAPIPAGKNEVKVPLKIAADAAPGNRTDLVVRATGIVNGNVPVVQEVKFNVNIVK